jgi:hypothetical protein
MKEHLHTLQRLAEDVREIIALRQAELQQARSSGQDTCDLEASIRRLEARLEAVKHELPQDPE